jgi:hypothetical protein
MLSMLTAYTFRHVDDKVVDVPYNFPPPTHKVHPPIDSNTRTNLGPLQASFKQTSSSALKAERTL